MVYIWAEIPETFAIGLYLGMVLLVVFILCLKHFFKWLACSASSCVYHLSLIYDTVYKPAYLNTVKVSVRKHQISNIYRCIQIETRNWCILPNQRAAPYWTAHSTMTHFRMWFILFLSIKNKWPYQQIVYWQFLFIDKLLSYSVLKKYCSAF